MLVGYARTSSFGQVAGLEAQERELLTVGCEKVFREQVSSVAHRDQLEAALDFCRDGDQFIVTKLDRLARSVGGLLNIVARLAERETMLERQREGIANAQREGRYKGRTPTARRQAAEIIRPKEAGVKPSEIAARLKIGRASVRRHC